MNKKLIRLTESDLHKIVKESVHKILKESILDNMDLQVDRKRYGKFWLRDKNTWIEFNAEAWIEDGRVMCNVDSDDRRGSQMCNSESFRNMCAREILETFPRDIPGFQEYIDDEMYEGIDYDVAYDKLWDDLFNRI